MTGSLMPTSHPHLEPTPLVSRRGMLFVAGTSAAVHIVGCTTEEDSSNGTFGPGGGNSNSVAAGADGGAPRDAGVHGAMTRR
jgi:hypothetical protein